MSKTKVPTVDADKIHLSAIKVIKARFDTSEEFLESPKETAGFEFGIAKDFAYNLGEKRTRLRLFFTFDGRNEQEESVGLTAEYGIEVHFHIENMEEFVQEKGDGMQIDSVFGATLLGIGYSTARGIILERMQGTFFDSVILPVTDPHKVLLTDNETT
jgi:hypothetical protein